MTEVLMALVVFLVCLAWWPCCCSEIWSCAGCDATPPLSVSVTISGVTDGSGLGWSCDCSTVNGTHILPWLPGFTCAYRLESLDHIDCTGTDDVDLVLLTNFPNTTGAGRTWYGIAYVYLNMINQQDSVSWSRIDTFPLDCTAEYAFSTPSSTYNIRCGWASATWTLN